MTLRKNLAGQHVPFLLVSAADGSALTGATVTARRSLDGGAQAAATGAVSELGNGQYDFAPSQADTNANVVGYLFTAASAIPVHFTIYATAADPTNATTLGITNLDAAISTRLAGGSYTAPDNAGITAIQAKTDLIPTDPAETSDIPSAAAIATQVRTELGTELGRLDAAVSSRLAGASYTAPDNATIAAIDAKTTNLPADPAGVADLPAAPDNAGIAAVKAKTDALVITTGRVRATLDGEEVNAAIDEAAIAAAIVAELGSVTDPLLNAVPGAYPSGTAGYVLGTYLDSPVSEADAAIAGGVAVTLVERDSEGAPRAGVRIWLTTDEEGITDPVVGGLTDADGKLAIVAPAGTYYKWRVKAGIDFPNPREITLS